MNDINNLSFIRYIMNDINNYILFNLLRDLRKKSGLTQEELSIKLKKPQSYVSKYESGEKRLDYFELREVCRAIGVGMNVFVNQIEEKIKK